MGDAAARERCLPPTRSQLPKRRGELRGACCQGNQEETAGGEVENRFLLMVFAGARILGERIQGFQSLCGPP